mmetsp:Transcript_31037/g.55583  ORF Transcript_31037/g.55583 Transcript_31037/m.55583 type:complete len:210 (-) Transcript_31037:134-763(-)
MCIWQPRRRTHYKRRKETITPVESRRRLPRRHARDRQNRHHVCTCPRVGAAPRLESKDGQLPVLMRHCVTRNRVKRAIPHRETRQGTRAGESALMSGQKPDCRQCVVRPVLLRFLQAAHAHVPPRALQVNPSNIDSRRRRTGRRPLIAPAAVLWRHHRRAESDGGGADGVVEGEGANDSAEDRTGVGQHPELPHGGLPVGEIPESSQKL